MKLAKIHIKNLKLKAIIGVNDWERKEKQDIIINIFFEIDAEKSSYTDNIEDTSNYRILTKKIIEKIEVSNFFLLEKLTDTILDLIMEDTLILKASIKIEKINAITFSDSVSVEMERVRNIS